MEKTAEQKYVGNFDEVFPVIDPSKLIGHKILKYKTKKGQQEILMNDICQAIKQKLPAFRTHCMDPSEENGKIVFKPGNKPAVGHSPEWWDEKWKEFDSEKNSRSGNRLERAAYLGTIIMFLVDEKHYSVAAAWESVCDDSSDLGHYRNSKNAKNGFEPTGSRKVGVFFDLANIPKIIRESVPHCFLLAGGGYNDNGYDYPLVYLCTICDSEASCYDSVGWLVMDV